MNVSEALQLVKDEAQNVLDVCDWALSQTLMDGPAEMYNKAIEARATAQATVDSLAERLPETVLN